MYKAILYGLNITKEINLPYPYYKLPFILLGKEGEIIFRLYDTNVEELTAIYIIDSCLPPLNNYQLKMLGKELKKNEDDKDNYEY